MASLARYKARATTAAEAVRRITPGQRIFIGSGAAEPLTLVEALVGADHLAGNEVVHLLTLGPAPYVAPELSARFRHTAFFIGANTRAAVNDGRADFMPVFLSEIPRLVRDGRLPIDVALIQVSPPDHHGFMTLGVSVDIVRAAVDTARYVVAEVNPRMPRTWGDTALHVDQVDAFVDVDCPLLQVDPGPLDAVTRAIGENVARLVPDGATLQMGIGRIPDAVLTALSNHRDLGVHTEMFSDGLMRLVESGVVNGRRKTFLPGRIVTSFVMGTKALYDWVHDHPAVEFRGSDFTNDPFNIARNDRMIAINSAIEVDLTGQVAADSIGTRFYSGIGGQVDFIRGASRSHGGLPIIALPSTAAGGQVSRIQPVLEAGSGVVTSRGDVHFVVTEYGAADLWGRSVRARAEMLIGIAHPDFRGELRAKAISRRYIALTGAPPIERGR
ncbi:MAG: acetyl-CoA hydrolase/transferase family protein [Myxococcales bacterium]|nr:acetyl-CoA hydrolase/transferase family protein [Myxococcales bacterium]